MGGSRIRIILSGKKGLEGDGDKRQWRFVTSHGRYDDPRGSCLVLHNERTEWSVARNYDKCTDTKELLEGVQKEPWQEW